MKWFLVPELLGLAIGWKIGTWMAEGAKLPSWLRR